MAYKFGDQEVGPIRCDGCDVTRDEVIFVGRDRNGESIWRCRACLREIQEQMSIGVGAEEALALGVDRPTATVVKSGKSQSAKPRDGKGRFLPKQGSTVKEKTNVSTPQIEDFANAPVTKELKQGKTSQATFVLDKADVGGGIRAKGDRKTGQVYGSLYIPEEIAGKSTEFIITIEPVN